jgi:general secretion pathway protein J
MTSIIMLRSLAFFRTRRAPDLLMLRAASGFTLVEMLVAVSLLGLLGVISWRGLDHVMTQRTRVSEQSADIERVLRTIAQIDRDVREHVADALLPDALSEVRALPKSMAIVNDGQPTERVTILRRNPVGTGVLTVTYFVRDDALMRMSSVDDFGEPDGVVMLDEVDGFQTRWLSEGEWTELAAQARSAARAIEFTIVRRGGERFLTVVPI